MFSNNDKISTRQIFRLFVFDFVGESTLVLPAKLATLAGNDGMISIIIGGVLGSLYLWYLTGVLRRMQTDLVTYMEQSLPAWLNKVFLCFFTLHFIGMAGYGACIFSDVMRKGLIHGESYTLILVLVLLVAGYAVAGGVESRARVYEILFWILFLLLLLMLILAAKELDPQYLTPFFTASCMAVVKGSIPVLFCLMPLFLLLFFPAYVEKKNWGRMVGAAGGALWFTIAVVAILYVVLLGTFGWKSMATMEYPAVTLMSSIHLRGSFLKRLDAFMVGIWFFTLFALVNVFLHYGKELLQHLLVKEGKPSKKKAREILILSMLLVFLVAEWLYYGDSMNIFLDYISFVGGPLLIVFPAVLLMRKGCLGKGGGKNET